MLFRRRGSKDALADGGQDERNLNRRVTRALAKADKQNKQTVKLLILGSGDSGKSTLRKQFSRLYANAFSDATVRIDLKDLILFNLIDGMQATLAAADEFAGGVQSEEGKLAAKLLKNLPSEAKFTDDIANAFRVLHEDPVIQEVLDKHRSKYQLQECFIPFFEQVQNFPIWGGPIWIPSEDGMFDFEPMIKCWN